jgi:dihydropyrimidine dehydrogenase (NAD+) subunit PreT
MAVAVRPRRRILPYVLALILIGTAAALLYRGWSFYKLGLLDRPDHPDFRTLRPSGVIGNGYGYAGGLLVFMNLSYLVRRRLSSTRLGSMKVWLDLHVFTGLLAAIFVSFHSAFQLRTPIATATSASLGVVVLTGLLGRFLYALSPAGQARRLGAALDELEGDVPGSREPIAIALDGLPGPMVAPNASLFGALLAIPRWRRVSRQRREAIDVILADRIGGRRAKKLVRAVKKAASADARSSGAAALLRTWRGLHRFFAILMLLAVGLHIAVAWHYGYRWIFS